MLCPPKGLHNNITAAYVLLLLLPLYRITMFTSLSLNSNSVMVPEENEMYKCTVYNVQCTVYDVQWVDRFRKCC